jgi:Ca2+-binding RTX toxin-like protein
LRTRRSLSFESLENRTLLAASNILIEDGLLGFRGTNGDDVMRVEHIGQQYKLTLNGQSTLINDIGPLDGVIVDGRAGNDQITIDSSVTVFTGALGGKGNDVIQGGGGENYLFGDAGNDFIYSGIQGSSNLISGGAGDDIIFSGDAATIAHGDKGNDTLYGDNTSAWLYGDAGNDTLYAGNARCLLYGGAGNDTIYSADNGFQDEVYGGAGKDIIHGNADVIWRETGTCLFNHKAAKVYQLSPMVLLPVLPVVTSFSLLPPIRELNSDLTG